MLVTRSVMANAKIPSVNDSMRFFSISTLPGPAGSVIPVAIIKGFVARDYKR
jgi:hypothetical protein